MQKKNGISLIVLVITIIVMIILAGVIMISLNNSGIIKKAEQAVEDTNLQEIRNLAALKWSEVYLEGEGKYTQSDLHREVIARLDKENLDLTPYDIKVTSKGVSVNRIQYYTTLREAVDAVNADASGTITNVKKEDAVSGIYIENGTPTVVLLKDTTETEKINLEKDMTIDLGGHKVTFNECIGFSTVKNNICKIYIDGTIEGSEIYSVRSAATACAIQVYAGNTVKIEGAILSGISESSNVRTVNMLADGSIEIINCKINAITKAALGNPNIAALGIVGTGNVTIVYSEIFADSRGTDHAYDPVSIGIDTLGVCNVKDCYIYGTHTGINMQAGSKLYIEGGTLETPGLGGVYCSVGAAGEAYIDGAKINRCEYKGDFEDFSNKSKHKSALYIGGAQENTFNSILKLNNCEITSLEGPAIKFVRGKNNELYISNSKISKEYKISIDKDTIDNKLYIGKGCNFNSSNVEIPSGVELTDVVEETDEVYTRPNN